MSKFNIFNEFDDLEFINDDKEVMFLMIAGDAYVTAIAALDEEEVDTYDYMDPENGHTIKVKCLKGKKCRVYDVDDFDAEENEEFELTDDQEKALNKLLGEMV